MRGRLRSFENSTSSLPRAHLAWTLGLACVCLAVGTSFGSELRHTATVRVVRQAQASVVNIHGQKTLSPSDEGFHKGDPPQRVNGMGTGVVIDERGYIITNHHVVDGVKKIQVTLADKQTYIATLMSHDLKTDLAIIKINATQKLPVITIGTSSDLMTGESVIAMGNAYGYEHTVTEGIVSQQHRSVQVSESQSYEDLIQTDASINPGNSGGPLLNIDGEMIGINVAVRAGAQGIGFAIPVDMAMRIAADLMSIRRLDGAWHGVVAGNDDPMHHEVVVAEVEPDSPAAAAGLQAGDVIASAGNCEVARRARFRAGTARASAGDSVSLVVRRRAKPVELSLKLGQAAPRVESPVDQAWEVIGLKFEPISAKHFLPHQSRYHGGLLITAVRPDSPAARQSIRRGDVLVGMHVWETVTPQNVAYILNRPDFATIEPLKFYILRGNETLYGHLRVSMRP